MNAELERRVAERTSELSTANRRLQEFVYAVSHDLRTPLRAIDGFSLTVLESEAEVLSEAGKDDLRRVRAAAQRLGRVIDGVVSLASVGRGQLVLERVDLSRMAAQIVAELRAAQPERTVEVAIAAGPGRHDGCAPGRGRSREPPRQRLEVHLPQARRPHRRRGRREG